MPFLKRAVPKYCLHRASGQAVVNLGGKDFYLGPHGSTASKAEYDRLIAEWLTSGRRANGSQADLTVCEAIARYWDFAKQYYCKNGKPTSEVTCIKYAVKPLKELYGSTLVADFGPLALKALQKHLIDANLSRNVINSRIGIIKRMFRWCVSEQLAPPSLSHGLDTVVGLRKGRSAARETQRVLPVEDAAVDATLPFLPEVVADMVQFQRLTGARPQEVFNLRPRDIDRSQKVWLYVPAAHKTMHRGRDRIIPIGPKGQAILQPYLLRDADGFCFSPAESERKRKAILREHRKTNVQPSQQDRSKAKPKRAAGCKYARSSYLNAIRRACDRAFPVPDGYNGTEAADWRKRHRWCPLQLRHSAATTIRKQFGLEAAQVLLGHAKADVTQVYAERDLALAVRIMGEVG